MLKIVTYNGRDPSEEISDILKRVSDKLSNTGSIIQKALLESTRRHVQSIYPSSKHYDPAKVTEDASSNGTTATGLIDIDIPGITRAYHDIDIKPKFRNWLTIPMHQKAYGKKAAEFNDLICITKKDGRKFLAMKEGTGLAFMYVLSKGVHQNRDSRLLPSDLTYADNIFARIQAYLSLT